MNLPDPSPDAREFSLRTAALIADEVRACGWLPFSRFMELALYAPGAGYYSGGAHKFGAAGDFVTAPEISALFAQCLATAAEELMAASAPMLIEAGAGSGVLAVELLAELERRDALPEHYGILELSGELRERQRALLAARVPALAGRVSWLDRLPETYSGVVLGNELLDALPCHLVHWTDAGIMERGVELAANNGFRFADRPASGPLLAAASALPVTAPYLSEINLAARSWTAEWGHRLQRGALLLIDYGYPRSELYHPQRTRGTLRCHYRHLAHDDPFFHPGLQDITAHVDFSAVAEAGANAGLDLLGYCSQGQFLLNCGLTDLLRRFDPQDPATYMKVTATVGRLVGPGEMGELFKAICLGRGVAPSLRAFGQGDRSHALSR